MSRRGCGTRPGLGWPDCILGESFYALLGGGQARRRRSTGACCSTPMRGTGRAPRPPVLAREPHPSDRYVTTCGHAEYRPGPDDVRASATSRSPATGRATASTAAAWRPPSPRAGSRPGRSPATRPRCPARPAGWPRTAGRRHGDLRRVRRAHHDPVAVPVRRRDAARLLGPGRRGQARPALRTSLERAVGRQVPSRRRRSRDAHLGRIPDRHSLDPRFVDRGTVDEDQVAIWVPVSASRPRHVRRLHLARQPDVADHRTARSSATPRPGARAFPAATTARSGSRAFGLEHTGANRRGVLPLLEVTGPPPARDRETIGRCSFDDLPSHGACELLPGDARAGRAPVPARISRRPRPQPAAIRLPQAAAGRRGPRDRRAAADHGDAYVIRRLRAWPLVGTVELQVDAMDSHPLIEDLGWIASRSTWATGARWTSTSATAACCGRAEATARELIAMS